MNYLNVCNVASYNFLFSVFFCYVSSFIDFFVRFVFRFRVLEVRNLRFLSF